MSTPTLWLSESVAYMLLAAARTTETLEVGGLLAVTVEPEFDSLLIEDILIPPQVAEGAHFEVPPEQFVVWLNGLAEKEMAEHGQSPWVRWRGVWHSHCSMGVTPSGADTDQVHDIASVENNVDWAIGLIVNVRGDMGAWISGCRPVEWSAKLDVAIVNALHPELDERVSKAMKHVKGRKTTAGVKQAHYWPGGGGTGPVTDSDDDLVTEAEAKADEFLEMLAMFNIDAAAWEVMTTEAQASVKHIYEGFHKDEKPSVTVDHLKRGNGRVMGEGLCFRTAKTSTGESVYCRLSKGVKHPTHVGIKADGTPAYFYEEGQEPPEFRRCGSRIAEGQCVMPQNHTYAEHVTSNKGLLSYWPVKKRKVRDTNKMKVIVPNIAAKLSTPGLILAKR